MADVDPWVVCEEAANALRRSSALLRAIESKRPDLCPHVDPLIEHQDQLSQQLVRLAYLLRPLLAIVKWNQGTAEAMKNYHPNLTPPKG